MVLERLSQIRTIGVMGKGGVGKSACAAALALALSDRAHTTLLMTLGGEGALPSLTASPCEPEPTQLGPHLWAAHLDPEPTLQALLARYAPTGRLAGTVLGNPTLKRILQSAPMVHELALWIHTRDVLRRHPALKTAVLDMPASGRALALLGAPDTCSRALRSGGLAKRAHDTQAWLTDPEQTRWLIVTLPEQTPTHETLELHARLSTTLGLRVEAIVLNQTRTPEQLDPEALDALLGHTRPSTLTHDPALRALLQRERNASRQEQRATARLSHALPHAPLWRLPSIPDAPDTGALVRALADRWPDAATPRMTPTTTSSHTPP